MKKIKSILLVLGALMTMQSYANSARGFITTLANDTVWGFVQVSRFNQVTGGLLLHGIELESFHSRVVFRADDEKRFKSYFPEMISGFGFKYKDELYIFQQQIITHKNMFSGVSEELKFMRVQEQTNLLIRFKEPVNTTSR